MTDSTIPGSMRLPEHWTPEQALAAHEIIDALSQALWQRYGDALIEIIDAQPAAGDDPQLDLFDDPLPF